MLGKQDSLCFSHRCSVSLVPRIQACNFNNRQSPAVNVYNRTRANRWASFSHLRSVYPGRRGWALLQSAVEQTTVRPPGHQWTGTNHQSEWLLMELEQLPQTIKKGRNDINSDVLKGGVGGGCKGCSLVQNSRARCPPPLRPAPLCSTALSELEV